MCLRPFVSSTTDRTRAKALSLRALRDHYSISEKAGYRKIPSYHAQIVFWVSTVCVYPSVPELTIDFLSPDAPKFEIANENLLILKHAIGLVYICSMFYPGHFAECIIDACSIRIPLIGSSMLYKSRNM